MFDEPWRKWEELDRGDRVARGQMGGKDVDEIEKWVAAHNLWYPKVLNDQERKDLSHVKGKE